MTDAAIGIRGHVQAIEGPRRTIGGKLNRLVLISVGIALIVVASLSCWGEAKRFMRYKREVMVATAQVFASAVSNSVAAGDQTAVLRAIRGVARVPGLVHVGVRKLDGSYIAEIGTGAVLSEFLVLTADAEPSALALLGSHSLTLKVPVIESGERVGEIEVVSDTSGMWEQFGTAMTYALLGSAGALAIGLLCSVRLQRSITRPLTALTQAMVAVERTRDFGMPVEVTSDDETGTLARRFNDMMTEIRQATDRILLREKEIIERLARAGELRDDQTGQHVVRVAAISGMIATELGLAPDFIDDLCRASPMHDVGKISIPDAILHKPGPLEPAERRAMEQHARRGFEILEGSSSELVQLAAEIALSHHEKWDGTGYPARLAGTAIPLPGRITAVADVCDALLSARPYKVPWPLARVRELLTSEAGAHFDPACVAALIARWSDLERYYPAQSSLASAA